MFEYCPSSVGKSDFPSKSKSREASINNIVGVFEPRLIYRRLVSLACNPSSILLLAIFCFHCIVVAADAGNSFIGFVFGMVECLGDFMAKRLMKTVIRPTSNSVRKDGNPNKNPSLNNDFIQTIALVLALALLSNYIFHPDAFSALFFYRTVVYLTRKEHNYAF